MRLSAALAGASMLAKFVLGAPDAKGFALVFPGWTDLRWQLGRRSVWCRRFAGRHDAMVVLRWYLVDVRVTVLTPNVCPQRSWR